MAVKDKNHHLIQRGDTWYLVTKANGKRIRKALSQSITEARRKRNEHLEEIRLYGDIQRPKQQASSDMLFGEVAQEWIQIISKEIKTSTLRDYRYSMNRYVLPAFGNRPIGQINYLEIKKFVSTPTCSHKRKNSVLVPMRSVFKMAFLSEIIDKSPMDKIKNLKIEKPDIHPLSMDEVRKFLESVSARFRNFFVVAFFTGMRFGEMSALKWRNVDFKLGVIKVRETRVLGEEGRPKTKKSSRDIKMLAPVIDALRDQMKQTVGKTEAGYVFLNQYGKPVDPMPTNFHVWKTGAQENGSRT